MTGGGETPADRAGTEEEMGDQRSDGGATVPRRARSGRAPGSAAGPGRRSGPGDPAGASGLVEALFSAALREDGPGAEAERRAVAAFRAARDAGAHRAVRARRRDDWRPRQRRRVGRPLKAALSVLLAGLTLGGAAYAAIGGGPAVDGRGDGGPRPPAATAPADRPASRPAAPPAGGPAVPDRAAGAGDAMDPAADCRAYHRTEDRGEPQEAAVPRRLAAAAGGGRRIAAYCVRQDDRPGSPREDHPAGQPVRDRARDSGAGDSGGPGDPGGPGNPGDAGGSGASGGPAGPAGSGGSGGSGSAGNAAGSADRSGAGGGRTPDRRDGGG
ncbi:hypothetical protein AB0L74_14860 [Streptomyces sp. NPDC052020]|uniref:hypothetical protein n=1 Tax=Streptomyces sp. NPDC052020 TaxID=3155677 RepID=UPI00343AC969